MSRRELSIIALIGIILLIGIVKKNAIMMIDFAIEAERERGARAREAIYQACLLRFRPIMMTTLAALLGACRSPSATGRARSCAGRSASPSSAACIFSQVLTLFTTPVVYLALDRFTRQRRSAVRAGPAGPSTARA